MPEDPAQAQNGLTDEIRRLWELELGRDDVGVTDDVFDLGATSLHAMRVVSAITAGYGVEVPLPVFFGDPTVQGMSDAVQKLLAGA